MPIIDQALLTSLCRERIAAVNSTFPLAESAVVCILERNLARGRYQRIAQSHSLAHPIRLEDYVDLVLAFILKEYPRIDELERGDRAAWQQVYGGLVGRSRRILAKLRNDPDLNERAFDFASETCKVIFEQPYPYDVAFDAWATTILRRIILAYYSRSVDAMVRGRAESLDSERLGEEGNPISWGDLIADAQSAIPYQQVEDQMVLDDAIAQLRSSNQRRVICESYLDGLSDAVIARRLGKSKQAVYNLRSRALAQLKLILSQSQAKERDEKNH